MKKLILALLTGLFIMTACSVEDGIVDTPSAWITNTNHLYISLNGSDDQSGNASAPLENLKTALQRGIAERSLLIVYMEAGEYSLPDGTLNIGSSFIQILGGYEKGYTVRTNYTVFNGNQTLSPLFSINGGSATSNVLLERLVFTGGYTDVGSGAGMVLNANHCQIIHCIFSNNYASGGAAALLVSGHYNVFSEVLFISNSSDIESGEGGAMTVNGNGNSGHLWAKHNAAGKGSVLFLDSGNENQFQFDAISNQGSVVYLYNAHSNLINGHFSDNLDSPILLLDSGYNTLNATLVNNIANNGGAIHLTGDENRIEGIFSNNTATNNGGALYCVGNRNTCSAFIISNTAGIGGGAHFTGNNNVLTGMSLRNYALQNTAGLFLSGNGNVVSTTIVSNHSDGFGGGLTLSGSNNSVSGTIAYNSASHFGGGVYLYNAFYAMVSGSVYNNLAPYVGGGVYISGGRANQIESVMTSNLSGNGGAVYIGVTAVENSVSGSIQYNSATNGAAVYIDGSNNTITAPMSNNIASENGAGLYIAGLSNRVSAMITGNIATNTSGILIRGKYNQIQNCVITNNLGSNVISLYSLSDSGVVVSNCLLGGYSATVGVGILEEYSDATGHKLYHNTFITNKLQYLYWDYASGITNNIAAVNSIFYHDAAVASGNMVQ